jgi:hypothetical protein
MARPKNGVKKQQKEDQQKAPSISLLDARYVVFQLGSEMYNLEDAPDAIFDTWVRQRLQIGWTLQERVDAVNAILAAGKASRTMQRADTAEEAIQAVQASKEI